jgi:hypothetical protein
MGSALPQAPMSDGAIARVRRCKTGYGSENRDPKYKTGVPEERVDHLRLP